MQIAYWSLFAAYIGWLSVFVHRFGVLWKWLGNDPHSSSLSTPTHGTLDDLRGQTFAPFCAYVFVGILSLTVPSGANVVVIFLGHYLMAFWLVFLHLHCGESHKVSWILGYKPPHPDGGRFAGLVWLHRRLHRASAHNH